VIGTGISRSVRDLLDVAFEMVGLDWHDFVETDSAYTRPSEVPDLVADPTKARRLLGWEAETSFEEMIREMLEVDVGAAGLDPAAVIRPRT
jgi:GDPmannose 4,6-dehydratase